MNHLLIFASFLWLNLFSSDKNTVYFDANWKKIKNSKEAAFYDVTTVENKTKSLLKIETYFISGQIMKQRFVIDGEKKVNEGKFKEWNEQGALLSEIEYKDGKRDGELLTFWPDGKPRRADIYKNGKFVKGKCFDTNGFEVRHFDYQVPASFPGGQNALAAFIKDNISYPFDARKLGIEGTVVVSFEIDKEGRLSDYAINRSVDKELDREALRIVKSMPQWLPGSLDGDLTSSKFHLPVNFSLK